MSELAANYVASKVNGPDTEAVVGVILIAGALFLLWYWDTGRLARTVNATGFGGSDANSGTGGMFDPQGSGQGNQAPAAEANAPPVQPLTLEQINKYFQSIGRGPMSQEQFQQLQQNNAWRSTNNLPLVSPVPSGVIVSPGSFIAVPGGIVA